MRTSKVHFLKLLALVIMMIASLSGTFSLTASAGVSSHITGVVADANGSPLEGATVCLADPDYVADMGGGCALTDGSGAYTLNYVPEGGHSISASLDGYEPQSQTVTVGIGDLVEVNFTLPAVALTDPGEQDIIATLVALLIAILTSIFGGQS